MADGPSPRTLSEAHEVLGYLRPSPSESAETWLKYYRRNAVVYTEVAEIDRFHHHEALYWAGQERARANSIAAEMKKSRPRPATGKAKEDSEERGKDDDDLDGGAAEALVPER